MVPVFFVPFEFLYKEMKRTYPKVHVEISDEESRRLMRENVLSKISEEEFLKSVLK